jgi:hypothetical protein
MSDFLGRIPVPTPVASTLPVSSVTGAQFPLISDFNYGYVRPAPFVEHAFGTEGGLVTQRFFVGFGPRKFAFQRAAMNWQMRRQLTNFWESVQGSYQYFTYAAPQADHSTTNYTVTFEAQPLSLKQLVTACEVGFNLVECQDPSTAPSYTVSHTCLGLPCSDLTTAFQSQTQQIIPLIHIRPRECDAGSLTDNIYLSDRRCTVGTQLYLPRILGIGDPNSGELLSQDISGSAENVQFTLGNADRAMTKLSNDTDLKFARVELCLYHVQSQTLLQLWAGYLISFQADGTARFQVRCSDRLAMLTQQYPLRNCSHTCWKLFNDGVNCPYAAHGSGSGSTCSYYFSSPSPGGCHEHGMDNYFGGIDVAPQKVQVGSRAALQFKPGLTPTSIVDDAAWGKPLPEIWMNDDGDPTKYMPANCIIVSGRDEISTTDGSGTGAYAALGLVGQGPLGAYSPIQFVTNADGYIYLVCPTIDGVMPLGLTVDNVKHIIKTVPPNGSNGYRLSLGADPNPDQFGLMNGLLGLGYMTSVNQRAAGTAFAEIRIPVPNTDLSTPAQHTMVVYISQGLRGYTFAGGSRIALPGLTNPFWIAANCYLRALGLWNADSATQIAQLCMPSLYAGDGSGTAEIADALVNSLVGSGQEKQFRFKGSIGGDGSRRPFRDWLIQILNCGLGYFTWEFGQLRFGCRYNAVPTEAFGLGNMLFQSLSLQPIEAAFERLVVNFADEAYQYQNNSAEYVDKTHAEYYGRAGSPLTSTQNYLGVASMSQAMRLAATRTREELGGVNQQEWGAARQGTFKSTVLGLRAEVGTVISITHPDLVSSTNATGTGTFRVLSRKVIGDWSVVYSIKTVTDSMYDLETGPLPVRGTLPPLPVMNYPQPVGAQWAPFHAVAAADDPLWPGEHSFDVEQDYTNLADGSLLARATVTGKMPVNQLIPNCGAPWVGQGSVTQATTGGSIPGGLTLRIQVCAQDSTGRLSPPSQVLIVQVPDGTSTNTLTIGGIQWPAAPTGATLTGYVVFLSDADDRICAQQSGMGQLSTITINGPFSRSTWAVPDAALSTLRLVAKHELYAGVAKGTIGSVSGDEVTSPDFVGTDSWIGRAVSVIGRMSGTVPWFSARVTGFDGSTGAFTLDRDASALQAGDTLVVRTNGYDNSAAPTVLTDAGYAWSGNPGGLPAGSLVGSLVRFIAGTGRGTTPATIIANTTTSVTLDRAVPIDATSVWIIESPTWEYSTSTAINNALYNTPVSLSVPLDNFKESVILISGVVVNTNGAESDDSDSPLRELYVYGGQGTRRIKTSQTMLPIDRTIECDTSGLTAPPTTTLAADIDDATETITLADGSLTVYNTDLMIGTERLRVQQGASTNALTVARGAAGTTPAMHLAGDMVHVPAILTLTCLPGVQIPNVEINVTKVSGDINAVDVAMGGTGTDRDQYPDGSYDYILPDNSLGDGAMKILFPGVPA